MRTLVFFVLFALIGCTCSPTPGPSPPPTTTTFTLTNPATCGEACGRLAELGCLAAKSTAKGTTCAEVCENAEHSGLALWGTACMVRSTSCAEADSCGGPL